MLQNIVNNWNLSVPYLLMSSYLYSHTELKCPLQDIEFDRLCKFVYRNWNKIEHRHKCLIEYDGLQSSHPVYLNEQEYPLIVRNAAEQWSESV